jgi:hypothetical protein
LKPSTEASVSAGLREQSFDKRSLHLVCGMSKTNKKGQDRHMKKNILVAA